ncbi:phosphotransferase [Pasteurella atlantica]|uniref:Phosphotransferase n=3 Tax=Pasteurellales TaxID=135625 RepID=A0ACC6HMV3_9PAST|nr:choline kinase family protein [Pasteurella atlantica]MDP8036158.1 phosphotransferase [Pasteurella atlantica]MDP8038108.1 phosphotransferase [Pasteurella atlantica]MDP8048463.1 phosphotransferase [Pasteurella atlantica]MDP8050420.1 phosphotransferase [Pasteurella atlantica]MDP8052197.1 phosphotransferase [Pasteurella atlantica]
MTNQNYLVCTKNKLNYVLRVPGAMTERLIERDYESVNSLLMSEQQFNVETCFIDANSGIKITKYLSNSTALDHSTIKAYSNLELIAKTLKKLHCSTVIFANEFNVFNELDKYVGLLKNKHSFYEYSKDIPDLLLFLKSISSYLTNNKVLVPCHNDLVPENILLKQQSVYFIDWEYSGMNDPMFDIAAFLLESKLNEEEQAFFLHHYFDGKEDDELLKKIHLYQFTQDILWFIWTLVKEENNEFFDDYGQIRIERAIQFMKNWKERENN